MKTSNHQFAVNLKASEDGRRFEGVAYSGGYIPQLMGVIDLASTRVADSAPVLFAHNDEKVVGVIEEFEISNKLAVSGVIHTELDEEAEKIVAKAKKGNRWQMSVGLFNAREEFIPAGNQVEMNGQKFQGPMIVLRGGEVREVSIVALGADSNTSAKFFNQSKSGVDNMDALQKLTDDVARLSAEVKKLTDANVALSAEKKAVEDKLAKVEADAKAERDAKRTADVKALFSARGVKLEDKDLAAYVAMSDEQFATVSAHFKASTGRVPPVLLTHQATGGEGGSGEGKGSALVARMKQSVGVKA